jgi:fermentation-respiration switch protein FrsA (DUF1100 family)
VLYLLTAYVLLCVAVFLFQRKLIYPASRLANGDPAASGVPSRWARYISATTADGVRLGGWQLLPLARGGEDFDAALTDGAVVSLFFHGNGGHRAHRGDVYALLGALGLHVVAFDYRGYGDSDGTPSEEGLAQDARAAWAWLVAAHGVPAGRVVLHGESLGCAVAVRLAQELCLAGTPPAGLVLESPFANLTETAAALYWFLPVRLLLRDRFPSDERIRSVTCPVLVFHGHRDPIVPFRQGRKLFDAAPAASASGRPKRFVEFPDAGHNDLRAASADLYEHSLREFLEGLKAQTGQTPPSSGSMR